MDAGIDYGMGQTNIDHETGIRYGVISMHSVAWFDDLDQSWVYPYNCPECARELEIGVEYESCPTCHYTPSDDSEWHGDEPIGLEYDDGEYQIIDCLTNDLMIVKSPYYAEVKLCSPCVPGAGDLDSPCDGGVRAYCLGPDWFDDYQPCPYKPVKIETED